MGCNIPGDDVSERDHLSIENMIHLLDNPRHLEIRSDESSKAQANSLFSILGRKQPKNFFKKKRFLKT